MPKKRRMKKAFILNKAKDKNMLPIPKGTEEEKQKGIRGLTCPYCKDSPYVKVLTDEALAWQNKCLNSGPDGKPFYRKEGHNYDNGVFCENCKTVWLWEGNVVFTYVGQDVPRIRELVTINGKTYQNFLPIKDWETNEYMPLLHPLAPLEKNPNVAIK